MKKIVAGVDEVGRGSLIGPVFAAAVIFKNIDKKNKKDSKKNFLKKKYLEKYIKKKLFGVLDQPQLRRLKNLIY